MKWASYWQALYFNRLYFLLCSAVTTQGFNTKQSGLTTSQFIVAAMLSRHVVVDLTLNVDGYKRT